MNLKTGLILTKFQDLIFKEIIGHVAESANENEKNIVINKKEDLNNGIIIFEFKVKSLFFLTKKIIVSFFALKRGGVYYVIFFSTKLSGEELAILRTGLERFYDMNLLDSEKRDLAYNSNLITREQKEYLGRYLK